MLRYREWIKSGSEFLDCFDAFRSKNSSRSIKFNWGIVSVVPPLEKNSGEKPSGQLQRVNAGNVLVAGTTSNNSVVSGESYEDGGGERVEELITPPRPRMAFNMEKR